VAFTEVTLAGTGLEKQGSLNELWDNYSCLMNGIQRQKRPGSGTSNNCPETLFVVKRGVLVKDELYTVN